MEVFLAETLFDGSAFLPRHGLVFDQEVVEIAPNDRLRERYGSQCRDLGEGSLLLPGLVNAHVHLEFSANRSTLSYGGFMPWLQSVITHRDDLISDCHDDCIEKAVQTMLSRGITAFGAVSSYGFDLEAAASAPQKVVFFNELIGSDPAMADALYANFLERLEASGRIERNGFYPAIAIHSPYSVHRILIQKALRHAREHALRVTAHFMESPAEREWLDHSSGEFKPFFENFLRQSKAANSADEFLDYFSETPALLTHAVMADEAELSRIARDGHTIIHCPISNRLLGNGVLDLERLGHQGIRWVCGTDGMSSNYTLDLFEEMKASLFAHPASDLDRLALHLWRSVTSDAGAALKLNCGTLAAGYDADLLIGRIDYPAGEQLPLHLILQPPILESVYIRGTKVKG